VFSEIRRATGATIVQVVAVLVKEVCYKEEALSWSHWMRLFSSRRRSEKCARDCLML